MTTTSQQPIDIHSKEIDIVVEKEDQETQKDHDSQLMEEKGVKSDDEESFITKDIQNWLSNGTDQLGVPQFETIEDIFESPGLIETFSNALDTTVFQFKPQHILSLLKYALYTPDALINQLSPNDQKRLETDTEFKETILDEYPLLANHLINSNIFIRCMIGVLPESLDFIFGCFSSIAELKEDIDTLVKPTDIHPKQSKEEESQEDQYTQMINVLEKFVVHKRKEHKPPTSVFQKYLLFHIDFSAWSALIKAVTSTDVYLLKHIVKYITANDNQILKCMHQVFQNDHNLLLCLCALIVSTLTYDPENTILEYLFDQFEEKSHSQIETTLFMVNFIKNDLLQPDQVQWIFEKLFRVLRHKSSLPIETQQLSLSILQSLLKQQPFLLMQKEVPSYLIELLSPPQNSILKILSMETLSFIFLNINDHPPSWSSLYVDVIPPMVTLFFDYPLFNVFHDKFVSIIHFLFDQLLNGSNPSSWSPFVQVFFASSFFPKSIALLQQRYASPTTFSPSFAHLGHIGDILSAFSSNFLPFLDGDDSLPEGVTLPSFSEEEFLAIHNNLVERALNFSFELGGCEPVPHFEPTCKTPDSPLLPFGEKGDDLKATDLQDDDDDDDSDSSSDYDEHIVVSSEMHEITGTVEVFSDDEDEDDDHKKIVIENGQS